MLSKNLRDRGDEVKCTPPYPIKEDLTRLYLPVNMGFTSLGPGGRLAKGFGSLLYNRDR